MDIGGFIIPSAILWTGNTPINLGIPGAQFSEAFDINEAGQIVGSTVVGDRQFATIWNGTVATDLNTLLATPRGDLILTEALAINDRGWIIGTAISPTGSGAYLLTPIPEPSTYALMLAGLGVLSFAARRRKHVLA